MLSYLPGIFLLISLMAYAVSVRILRSTRHELYVQLGEPSCVFNPTDYASLKFKDLIYSRAQFSNGTSFTLAVAVFHVSMCAAIVCFIVDIWTA